MDYLALCNRLAYESGVEGEPAFTSVAGNTGELGRIARWINSAWLDIQGLHNWTWMWENPDLTILAAANTIAGTIQDSRYVRESAYFNDGTPTRRLLDYMPWTDFRREWRVLNNIDNVTTWTVRPDSVLVFNAAVTANTLVSVERYAQPTEMVLDTDTPGLPTDLHEIIVWRALVKYANFDEARVQRDTAVDEYNTRLGSLMRRCLPRMELGDPMLEE